MWHQYAKNGCVHLDDIWKMSFILQNSNLPNYKEDECAELDIEAERHLQQSKNCLPQWFDPECMDCKAQWVRSFHDPEIPLHIPIGCPESPPQPLCLHSYKYCTDMWSYSIPWPGWAKLH